MTIYSQTVQIKSFNCPEISKALVHRPHSPPSQSNVLSFHPDRILEWEATPVHSAATPLLLREHLLCVPLADQVTDLEDGLPVSLQKKLAGRFV